MLKLKNYGISLLISFAITLVLLCVSAVIFAYTNIQDMYLQTFVFGIVFISNIIGSIIFAKKIKEKGILFGALYGLLFCMFLYLISIIAFNGFFVSKTLGIYFAVCIVSGIIGGVVGVNI